MIKNVQPRATVGVQFLVQFRISHVTHIICMPLVVHSNFSSKLMVTCLQVVRTYFDLFELDRKRNFEQFVNHVIMISSNPAFGPLPFLRTGPKKIELFEGG